MNPRRALFLTAFAMPAVAADWQPTVPTGKVSTDHFQAPADLEVTVWATTPMLFNPTNMDIDAHGRIWVAEGVNYRKHADRREGGDRIVVLEDTDRDGKADSSHTFVQEKALIAPLGVAVFDNKIVVSQPPDLLVYTDVDRDLKFDPAVDKREVLLSGFNAINHDHSLHAVIGGPDGKWYLNNGNCGAIFTDKSGKTFRVGSDYQGGGSQWPNNPREYAGQASDDGHVWTPGFSARMNPDGTDVEIIGHGYRNSYEHTVNSFGEVFQNDNDDPPACRNSYVLEYGSAGYFTRDGRFYKTAKRPNQPHWRNHWRQDDPGTFDVGDVYGGGSPTGVVFYENGALGEEHAGTYLSCEAGRNVIFAYKPQPQGASYAMNRIDWLTTNTTGEFLGSDFVGGKKGLVETEAGWDGTPEHILFRPSDVAVGPDGAIYVTDWFDPRVGGHADHDHSCSGTIYRIAPKDFTPSIPDIDLATVEGAIEALRSPAINVRWTGFNALKKKGAEALPAVLTLAQDANPWIAARAVWLLPHLGEEGVAKTRELVGSSDQRTALVAFRALRRAELDFQSEALQLAKSGSAALRRDAAIAMRNLPAEQSTPVLLAVAERWDGQDKNELEAIGLGAANVENEIWTALRDAQGSSDPLKWTDKFARLTWRLWPSAAVADLKTRAASTELSAAQRDFAVESLAFILDESAADALFDLVTAKAPSADAARDWLFRNGTGAWAKFGLRERLKETGIYEPEKITLTPVTVPAPAEKSNFSEEDVLQLSGDATRGKAVAARCTMCHQLDDIGPAYGPDLKGWVARQGAPMAVRAIVHPGADIAHGYEAVALKIGEQQWIEGIIQSDNDPVIITSTGGLTQLVPADRIKDRDRLDRSLMLTADQLGLTAQDVADLVEYLKTY